MFMVSFETTKNNELRKRLYKYILESASKVIYSMLIVHSSKSIFLLSIRMQSCCTTNSIDI